MNRRQWLATAGAMGAALAVQSIPAHSAAILSGARPLKAPAKGKIPVAVLVSEGVQVIDFAGPWEVFQDVHIAGRDASMEEMMPFELFTVASSTRPIRGTGGLQIVPDYTYENAPQARVIVVPAQNGLRETVDASKAWLLSASAKSDVTMSVCTGAFILAYAGMLDGLPATTNVRRLDSFAAEFPKVKVMRGARFVETDLVSTSAGLSAGIDLALRVVERYFGREVATATALRLEYEGKGWIA